MSKPRPAITPEREVLRQVLEVLAIHGIDADRQNTGAANFGGRCVRFGKKGNADISGMLPDGRKLDIEVKRPGKRPTPEQFDRLHRTNAGGGVGLWLDDAECFARLLPAILAGAWVEIDDQGTPWVTDGEG